MATRARLRRLSATAAAVCAALVAAGCGGGGETHGPVDPGGTQRAALTVTVSTSGSGIYQTLGWGSIVPGATVIATRQGSSQSATATTDAQGVATFADLLPGTYDVSSVRLLTADERAKLGASNADIDAVAGAKNAVALAAPTGQATVGAVAGRRGSLVISELYRDQPATPDGNFYVLANYLELHNNADTAVDLSNVVVAEGLSGWNDYPNFPCSMYESILNDPDGIWATDVYRFPDGTPPLPPGGTIVLATDAIDHSKVVAGTPDLSHADFEFRGTSDVDNPSVPNMVSLGPNSGDYFPYHGLHWYEVDEVVVVARASDVASLPTQFIPNSQTRKIARLPAATILDVLVSRSTINVPYAACAQAVNAAFDAQEFHGIGDPDPHSAQRKVVGTLPDGRPVLLRTKTSSRDFTADKPTPGTIP